MAEQAAQTWTPEDFKAWRKWMKWTQTQAAMALDVSRSSVAAWEDGTYPIDRRTVLACSAFRVARFLADNESTRRMVAADAAIHGAYNDLTEKLSAVDAKKR